VGRSADDRRASREEGLRAEAFVADVLSAEGWQILERNLHLAGGELDIVALRDGRLRVVEVKARAPGDDSALQSVTPRKQRLVQRAAEAYLQGPKVPAHDEVAFAVAAVCTEPDGWSVEWIDDAFDAVGW
jgi:Holliday junction resolvase-like predicted endonuclease